MNKMNAANFNFEDFYIWVEPQLQSKSAVSRYLMLHHIRSYYAWKFGADMLDEEQIELIFKALSESGIAITQQ